MAQRREYNGARFQTWAAVGPGELWLLGQIGNQERLAALNEAANHLAAFRWRLKNRQHRASVVQCDALFTPTWGAQNDHGIGICERQRRAQCTIEQLVAGPPLGGVPQFEQSLERLVVGSHD